MAQNSSESGDNSTIDSNINSQAEEKVISTVSNALNTTPQVPASLKQGLNASSNAVSLVPTQNAPVNQNGGTGKSLGLMELTRPVKTEGEASPVGSSTTTMPEVTNSTDHNPVTSLSETLTPMSALVPQLGTLGSQLTPEVQATAYKKANILALSALAKKGGPNAKEMLGVQQKLQEFLTSLITLAGQKGPQLKVAIQLHVQHLVTGLISEEEFAKRIETDLNSQHQPSLLPFLKSSVPHLKTRLQLQQAIMKELLQRQLAEKQQQQPSPSTQQTQPVVATTAPQKLAQTEQLNASLTPKLNQQQVSPASNVSTLPQAQAAKTLDRVPTPTKELESQSQKTIKGSSSNEPIVIPSSSTSNQVLAPTSVSALSTTNATAASATTAMLGLPKAVLDQLAKLPPEQQKFIYMHQYRKMQLLKQSQQQQQQNGTSSTLAGRAPVGISLPSTSQANAQTILERQQQLVKEQQVPLIMGGGGGGRAPTGVLSAAAAAAVKSVNSSLRPQQSSTSGSAQSSKGARTSFANMRLVPGGSPSSSSVHSPGKGKGKSKGKDVVDEEDDEVVGMDLLDDVGVNLQEETAHFLPQTVGETPSRTCTDEVFLDLPLLKRKVGVIARRHGISEVPEDFITLLSHATQERMRGVVEKLTQVSQHRVQTLKDDEHYQVKTETRSQLRILESIDRLFTKRKQERENELTLKAAKSRSKGTDPEKAAKIREEAKQIQQDEATKLRNEAANLTALAAIGSRRKRPLSDTADSGSSGPSTDGSAATATSTGNSLTANLFAPLSTTRAPKRHISSRDLIFYMEQERETRKSLPLYKALLK